MSRTRAAYQAHVRTRVRDFLLTIAPDIPYPLSLAESAIGADGMVAGPFESVVANLHESAMMSAASAAAIADQTMITIDKAAGTIAITAAAQARLRTEAPAPRRVRRKLDAIFDMASTLLVEMYHPASYLPNVADSDDDPDRLSRAQLGMLPPHLVHLAPQIMANDEATSDWGPAQVLVTLWLLNDHQVVPLELLATQTPVLIDWCERHFEGWGEETITILLQTVEEMLRAEWIGAPKEGGRILAMVERLLSGIDPADDDEYTAENRSDLLAYQKQLAAMDTTT